MKKIFLMSISLGLLFSVGASNCMERKIVTMKESDNCVRITIVPTEESKQVGQNMEYTEKIEQDGQNVEQKEKGNSGGSSSVKIALSEVKKAYKDAKSAADNVLGGLKGKKGLNKLLAVMAGSAPYLMGHFSCFLVWVILFGYDAQVVQFNQLYSYYTIPLGYLMSLGFTQVIKKVAENCYLYKEKKVIESAELKEALNKFQGKVQDLLKEKPTDFDPEDLADLNSLDEKNNKFRNKAFLNNIYYYSVSFKKVKKHVFGEENSVFC